MSDLQPEPLSAVRSTAELAARLGLSRWAVSRALNGRSGVSQETVARVRQALGEHQFAPDAMARGLRGARSGLVGICAPDPAATGGPSLAGLKALERRLREGGWRVWLELASGSPEREAEAVRQFLALRAEAVVLIRPRSAADSAAAALLRAPKAPPCLAVDPWMETSLPAARFDERQAAELVVGHLHLLGHRKLALLGLDAGTARRREIEAACEARGISCRADVRAFAAVDLCGPHAPIGPMELGWALAEELIRRRCAATAIIAADDSLAFGALGYLRQSGRTAPADFSIVGHGNQELAEYSAPGLTSIDPQFERLAERAADLLCEQMRVPGRVEAGAMMMNPLLVRRASTGPAPASAVKAGG